jgi:hypothetical protein
VSTFAGIELTSSPKKASAYTLLGADLQIRSLKSLSTEAPVQVSRLTKSGETLIFSKVATAPAKS